MNRRRFLQAVASSPVLALPIPAAAPIAVAGGVAAGVMTATEVQARMADVLNKDVEIYNGGITWVGYEYDAMIS